MALTLSLSKGERHSSSKGEQDTLPKGQPHGTTARHAFLCLHPRMR
jgi:hypothetical protein